MTAWSRPSTRPSWLGARPQAPRLVSGAFHDSIHLAQLCPTAMLFTPCRAGISHHPDEHIERADAEVAVRTLADAVERLLNEEETLR